jgi:chromosome partitioning protein
MALVITVATLKGGVGKTTTAVAIAEAASYGARTVLIDCDPQGSALDWYQRARDAGQPLRSVPVGIPAADLSRRLSAATRDADVAVIDAPPPGALAIARSAIEAADVVVMPCPPNLADLARIQATRQAAAEHGIPARVVLTMVRAGLAEHGAALSALAGSNVPVFATWLPLAVAVARNYGQPVTGILAAYGIALMGEILTIKEAESNG